MHWYAIHTKPRQESIAQASFEQEGIETFFPKLRRKRTIRRKYQWTVGPLFPNYLFARFDIVKSGRFAAYARGVHKIVGFGGKAVVVDDPIIETIMAHCEENTVTLPPPELKPGDNVEIQEGPFCGLRGIFQRELSDSQRVVILLHSIGAGARVEVMRDKLEKTG